MVTSNEPSPNQISGLTEQDEKYYRDLFENMLGGIIVLEVICDATGRPVDHRLLLANAQFELQTGLNREQEVGKTSEYLSFKWPDEVRQKYYLIAENGGSLNWERYNESLKKYYDVHVYSPKKGQFALVFYDITKYKNTEKALQESEARLRIMLVNDVVGIVTSKDRILQWANPAFNKLLGYQNAELEGAPSTVIFPSHEAYLELGKNAYSVLNSGKVFRTEIEYLRKDGGLINVDVSGGIINPETGEALWAAVDITERKKSEAMLRESEDRYRMLFNSTIDGVLLTIPDGRILEANPAACKMFQRTEQEIVQGDRNAIVDKSDPRLAPALEERKRTGKFMGELTLLRKDGTKFDSEMSTSLFTNKNGELRTSIFIRDVSRRKQLQDRIHHLAFFDDLTKLPNRRLLNDRLGQVMAASKRSSHYGALMFLDLDNFKPVNDNFGHSVGDALLIEAARRLSSCVRDTDTVARFGGDEFVVMLSGLEEDKGESQAQACAVAEKIRVCLSKTYFLKTRQDGAEIIVEYHCSSSIGVTLFKGHEISEDEIFKQADVAMYRAKEGGRNLVCCLDK